MNENAKEVSANFAKVLNLRKVVNPSASKRRASQRAVLFLPSWLLESIS
jgi:replication-associated recombination protein RarA